MNPLELQNELMEELKRMFKDMRFKNNLGESLELNVFAQNTPFSMSDEDEDPVPYVIVHLNDGEQKVAKDSFNIVDVAVIIAIYDDNESNQGHRQLFDMIYRIQERFSKKPALKKASFSGDFRWTVKDDNYYPYFFGACAMNFYIPSIRREDELS